MKKLNILLLSVVALGTMVTSCSKNDSTASSSPSASSLVGNWTYDTSSLVKNGTLGTEGPYNNASCTANINYLNITTGGTLKEGVVEATTQGGDPCTFTEYPGTWTFANNTIHIAEGQYTADYTIVSVTSSLLTVKYVPSGGDASNYYIYKLKK